MWWRCQLGGEGGLKPLAGPQVKWRAPEEVGMEMQMSAQVLYRTHLLQNPSHTGLLRIVLVIVLLYIGLRSLKGWCGR